jgi:hsp33 protein
MSDYIVRASAAKGMIRAFACTTKGIVEYAKNAHNTSPVVTAALGRLMSAAAMMGSMMKNEEDLLTLKIEGSGPMKAAIATATAKGNVKAYPFVPDVILPPNSKGKLDVAEAIGVGILSVISDIGLKEPYVGQVELISGEIAEDITYYYATSEQIPSSVALGVLMNKDNTVNSAGGFIIQLMPFCPEEVIEKLESIIPTLAPITALLSEGKTPEQILKLILGDLELEINDKLDISFKCDCSKEKIEKALISIGAKELNEMIDEGKDIEVACHFCSKKYNLGVDELEELLTKASN